MLKLTGITKIFGGLTALEDVSFTVKKGSITGVIGPNGAGKSTTVGMILGLIKPDRGSIHIAGQPLEKNPAVVARLKAAR